MHHIHSNETAEHSGKHRGVKRSIKHDLRIDMTPMVDLGFLLISFFVITIELSKPAAIDLYMPKEEKESELAESKAITFLLGGNGKVFFYEGRWEEAVREARISEVKLSGHNSLRLAISRKQIQLDGVIADTEKRSGLMMLIKPGALADYRTVVDVLDEATINGVKKYAIVKLSAGEKEWLRKKE